MIRDQEINKCSRCQDLVINNKLLPGCCLDHQTCVRCTARVISGKFGHQICYCCIRQPWYRHKGDTVCQKINIQNFHSIDYLTFFEENNLDIQNLELQNYFSVYAFDLSFIQKTFLKFDTKVCQFYTKNIEKAKTYQPLYYYQIPIEILPNNNQIQNKANIQANKIIKLVINLICNSISGLLNTLGEIKQLDPQVIVDYVKQNRNYIQQNVKFQYDDFPLRIRMYRTPQKLIVTLINKTTNKLITCL